MTSIFFEQPEPESDTPVPNLPNSRWKKPGDLLWINRGCSQNDMFALKIDHKDGCFLCGDNPIIVE